MLFCCFFLRIRRPPRSTQSRSSAASDVYKRQEKNKSKELKAQKEYEAAVELGKKMEELNVVIYAKAGDGGRLFGSITSKDIAEQIKKQHNIEVDKRKITLDEPIRVLGSRFVDIKIHQKVTTRLRVDVKEKQ